MKQHSRYHFDGLPGVYEADPPGVMTTSYEFETEEELSASGLLDDPRRTSCYISDGKYYVAGHFDEEGECER